MRLKHAVRMTAGGTPDVGDPSMWADEPDGVAWVSISDMSSGARVVQTERRLSLNGLHDRRLKPQPAGTVLFAMYASVGAVALLGTEAVWNQALLGLTPRPGIAEGRFVAYWLQHLRSDLGALTRTNTQANLNAEQVGNLPFIDRSVDEQRRVADYLDDQVARIDEVVRLREEAIGLLGERLAASAHAAVIGATRDDMQPTDLSWAAVLPNHWQVARLGLVAQMGTGHTPSRAVTAYWENADIPWLTTTDVKHLRSDEIETLHDTEVHISELGLRNSAAVMHPAGTVGICRTSASAGYSTIMGVPMATSQDFAVWRPSPKIVPGYLLWCLRAMRTDLLERLAMGSTHKTIYFPDLEGIRIPLPPLEEQAEIADRMHRVVAMIAETRAEMKAQIVLLHERKRSLITAAVTGEFDVTAASGRGVA